MDEKILTQNMHIPDIQNIRVYMQNGGYESLKKALAQMNPGSVTDEVLKSGLRGRGGAGFPTGRKWKFIPQNTNKPVYLICNADESEPGTFKDRLIIEKNPHMLLEGIIISCFAIGSHTSYIYIRGEFYHQARILEKTISEAYQKGFLGKNILGSEFDLDVVVHRGAGAYICGEETALLESLEGRRGFPRLKPPFPAVAGFMQCPTIVNNVETLANVPYIIKYGGSKYASIGTEKSTGTRLFSMSGHVNKPGVYELPHGIPLRKLIYDYCGGIKGGRPLKAVIPGGSSVPVLSAESIDIKMDFESVAEAGSMLGSAAV
ncbi:MAG: NADH-quinone oxidoreductase subunit F, partial [Candidatus Schekmanbacteria bacterium RBG_13_48_7]